MKERKDQKGKLDGRKRKNLESSKFERNLRKLECTVNYFEEEENERTIFAGLDEVSFSFLECRKG